MLSVAVHKDIAEYQPKIVGKMTMRTLVSITGALSVSVLAGLYIYFVLGLNVSDCTYFIYAQQLMAVFDATAAELSDANMAKVSTILMYTPALTSQQMRYLLAEAKDGTPLSALESMKEHLLAQAEPEKAQVTETGVKSESRDMASGKEALAERAGLDGTPKINQNKEME